MRKSVTFLIGLLIIIGALLACGSSTDTNTGTSAGNVSASGSTPTQAPATNKHFKIGEVVNVGSIWQITITGTRTSMGDQYEAPKDGNQYLVLSLVMKNISNQEQSAYGDAGYTLRDLQGTQFNNAYFGGDNIQNPPQGKVEAGSQVKGDLLYEVPKATKQYQLFYENNLFESGQTIWDISL